MLCFASFSVKTLNWLDVLTLLLTYSISIYTVIYTVYIYIYILYSIYIQLWRKCLRWLKSFLLSLQFYKYQGNTLRSSAQRNNYVYVQCRSWYFGEMSWSIFVFCGFLLLSALLVWGTVMPEPQPYGLFLLLIVNGVPKGRTVPKSI